MTALLGRRRGGALRTLAGALGRRVAAQPSRSELLERVDALHDTLAAGANDELDGLLLDVAALASAPDRTTIWRYLARRAREARSQQIGEQWAAARRKVLLDLPYCEMVRYRGQVHLLAGAWNGDRRLQRLLCGASARTRRLDRGTWTTDDGCQACARLIHTHDRRDEHPSVDTLAGAFDTLLAGWCERWPWRERHDPYAELRRQADSRSAQVRAAHASGHPARLMMTAGLAYSDLRSLSVPDEHLTERTWWIARPRASEAFIDAVSEAATRAIADALSDELRVRGDAPLLAASLDRIGTAHRALRDLPEGCYRLVDTLRTDHLLTFSADVRTRQRRRTPTPGHAQIRSAVDLCNTLVLQVREAGRRDQAVLEQALADQARRDHVRATAGDRRRHLHSL